MGCDIHQYTERLQDGVWVAEKADTFLVEQEDGDDYITMDDTGDCGRNYHLFGLLSEGVRYDCPWAFEPKGLVPNPSPQVASLLKQWEGDAHSHNYLTFQELAEKVVELTLFPGKNAQEWAASLSSWMNSMGESPKDLNTRRVVFWFDN